MYRPRIFMRGRTTRCRCSDGRNEAGHDAQEERRGGRASGVPREQSFGNACRTYRTAGCNVLLIAPHLHPRNTGRIAAAERVGRNEGEPNPLQRIWHTQVEVLVCLLPGRLGRHPPAGLRAQEWRTSSASPHHAPGKGSMTPS